MSDNTVANKASEAAPLTVTDQSAPPAQPVPVGDSGDGAFVHSAPSPDNWEPMWPVSELDEKDAEIKRLREELKRLSEDRKDANLILEIETILKRAREATK